MNNNKKLLIVEDDGSVRRVLSEEFRKKNLTVLEAENGEQAIELANREKPQGILLDVIMPKMHGMDFVLRIKETEWGKTVPIILLTNYADDPRVVAAVKEGRCQLLNKAETKLPVILETVLKSLS